MAFEVVLLVPVMVLLAVFVLWAGRGGRASLLADLAAEEAAVAAAVCCNEGQPGSQANNDAREAAASDVLSARPGLDYLCVGGLRPAAAGIVTEEFVRFDPAQSPESGGVGVVGVDFACESDGAVAPLQGVFPTVVFHGQATEVVVLPPAPASRLDDVEADEGQDLVFELLLDSPAPQDLDFEYWTEMGPSTDPLDNADPVDDFAGIDQATPDTAQILANDHTLTITIPTVADTLHERDETLELHVELTTTPAPVQFGQPGTPVLVAEGLILNDDDPPEISFADSVVGPLVEGTTFNFDVNLSTASGLPASARVNVRDVATDAANGVYGATSGSDYILPSLIEIVIAPGHTSATISVITFDDPDPEPGEEQFRVELSGPGGATFPGGAARVVSVGKIQDNEARLWVSNGCADEGDTPADRGVVEFTVSTSGAPAAPVCKPGAVPAPKTCTAGSEVVTFNYHTFDSPTVAAAALVRPQTVEVATANTDYVPVSSSNPGSGRICVGDGDIDTVIAVEALGDDMYEHPEQFGLEVTSNVAYVEAGSSLGQIDDDDAPPVLSVVDNRPGSPADAAADEGETLNFEVRLDAVSGKDATFDYYTVADTATAGVDYTEVPRSPARSVTITKWDTTAQLAVQTLTDGVFEQGANEEFELHIVDGDGVDLTGLASPPARGEIIDVDGPGIEFKADSNSNVFEERSKRNTGSFDLSLKPAVAGEPLVLNRDIEVTFAARQASDPIYGEGIQGMTGSPPAIAEYGHDYRLLPPDPNRAGSDYVVDVAAGTGTMTFRPGEETDTNGDGTPDKIQKTIYFLALDDKLHERPRQYFLMDMTLNPEHNVDYADESDPDKVSSADGTQRQYARGGIIDDESKPQLSIADASGEEGEPVRFRAELKVKVDQDPGSEMDVTFSYHTVDGTATGGVPDASGDFAYGVDYHQVTPGAARTVRIPAGDTSADFEVATVEDSRYEAGTDETFELAIAAVKNARAPQATPVGTITADDLPSLVLDIEGGTTIREGRRSSRSSFDVTLRPGATGSELELHEDLTLQFEVRQISDEISDSNIMARAFAPEDRARYGVDYRIVATGDYSVDAATGANGTITLGPADMEDTDRDGRNDRARKQIAFESINDTLHERDSEYFLLVVTLPSNDLAVYDQTGSNVLSDHDGTMRSYSLGRVVDDDDLPRLLYHVNNRRVGEGEEFRLIVNLDIESSLDASFEYYTEDITATGGDATGTNDPDAASRGVDYAQVPQGQPKQVTIKAGKRTPDTLPTIATVDDNHDENDEQFRVHFTAGSGLRLQPGGRTRVLEYADVTIRDDDDCIDDPFNARFEHAELEVDEYAGTAVLHVTLREAFCDETSVRVDSPSARPPEATAVEGRDYFEPDQTVTFAAGEATGLILVTIIDDAIYEGDELFQLRISLRDQQANWSPVHHAMVRIVDDEPVVGLGGDAFGIEGNLMAFRVELDQRSPHRVTVDYYTVNGTAVGRRVRDGDPCGGDYRPTPIYSKGTATIPAGRMFTVVTVEICDDGVTGEQDEQFTLWLANPSRSSALGTDHATGTIVGDLNSQGNPVVRIIGDPKVPEGGNLRFQLQLSAPVAQNTIVALESVSGTATEGEDFAAVDSDFIIPAGETSLEVLVATFKDDVFFEAYEDMRLVVTDADVDVSAHFSEATGRIRQACHDVSTDPPPPMRFNDPEGTEGERLGFTYWFGAPACIGQGYNAVQRRIEHITTDDNDLLLTTLDALGIEWHKQSYSNYWTYNDDFLYIWGTGLGTTGDRRFGQDFGSGLGRTIDDDLVEDNEQFHVVWQWREGLYGGAVIHRSLGTIIDNDSTNVSQFPVVSTAAGVVEAIEGQDLVFDIELSEESEIPVTVKYYTVSYYTPLGRFVEVDENAAVTVTFQPGTTTQTARIRTNRLNDKQDPDVIFLRLKDSRNALLGDAVGIGLIKDDET